MLTAVVLIRLHFVITTALSGCTQLPLTRAIENCLPSLKTESQQSVILPRAMDLWAASNTHSCIEVVITDINSADNFLFYKKMLLWWNTHSSTYK